MDEDIVESDPDQDAEQAIKELKRVPAFKDFIKRAKTLQKEYCAEKSMPITLSGTITIPAMDKSYEDTILDLFNDVTLGTRYTEFGPTRLSLCKKGLNELQRREIENWFYDGEPCAEGLMNVLPELKDKYEGYIDERNKLKKIWDKFAREYPVLDALNVRALVESDEIEFT